MITGNESILYLALTAVNLVWSHARNEDEGSKNEF